MNKKYGDLAADFQESFSPIYSPSLSHSLNNNNNNSLANRSNNNNDADKNRIEINDLQDLIKIESLIDFPNSYDLIQQAMDLRYNSNGKNEDANKDG